MKKNRIIFVAPILLYLSFYSLSYGIEQTTPQLTIIIEIDQFAHHYIPRIEKHLTGGIKFLLEHGVRYTNAYWPHAMPSTAIGHTAINTGTFANYHGVINNSWYDHNLKKIEFEDDSEHDAAVFSPDGLYSYGKSAHNIIVDGISDQLMLASTKNEPITVYALSYKSRAAIGNAGKLGKAIWFDTEAGIFTSSKAYFGKLPDWVNSFNKKISKDQLLQQKWKPHSNPQGDAYSSSDYKKTAPLQRVISVLGDKADKILLKHDEPYEPFIRTPAANTLLLHLAKTFITNYPYKNKDHRIVLWISLSPLDKLGHFYGPHSKEILDMIYHIDYQLKQFFDFVHKHHKPSEVLYLLTADHGVEPLPEYMRKKGIKNASRIIIPELCELIEEEIQKKHGVSIKCAVKTPQIYLDKNFDELDTDQQDAVLSTVKKLMENHKGIRKAWTYKELKNQCIDKGSIESYYKNQQYQGRSGHVIFQVLPYTQTTKYPAGTAHRTPYEWNTHVPLILYQKGVFEDKKINDRVWLIQVPNTLAQIHHVPKPSASTCQLLPGLFNDNNTSDNNVIKKLNN